MTQENAHTIEVPCTVEIECTPDFVAAHVSLEGIEVGPGDEVIVHGAPSRVAFGEHSFHQCRATVRRATAVERFMARIEGYLELTELYEVGFSAGRAS